MYNSKKHFTKKSISNTFAILTIFILSIIIKSPIPTKEIQSDCVIHFDFDKNRIYANLNINMHKERWLVDTGVLLSESFRNICNDDDSLEQFPTLFSVHSTDPSGIGMDGLYKEITPQIKIDQSPFSNIRAVIYPRRIGINFEKRNVSSDLQ